MLLKSFQELPEVFPAQRGTPPEQVPCQCPCGCTFFEEMEAKQIAQGHNVDLGQKAPEVYKFDYTPFYFYRCIKCKKLMEPNFYPTQNRPKDKVYKELKKLLETEE